MQTIPSMTESEARAHALAGEVRRLAEVLDGLGDRVESTCGHAGDVAERVEAVSDVLNSVRVTVERASAEANALALQCAEAGAQAVKAAERAEAAAAWAAEVATAAMPETIAGTDSERHGSAPQDAQQAMQL